MSFGETTYSINFIFCKFCVKRIAWSTYYLIPLLLFTFINTKELRTRKLADELVSSSAVGDQQISRVATLATGGFAISYQSYSSSLSMNLVYVRIFGSNGLPISTDIQVNTSTAYPNQNANICSYGSSGFVIVWAQVVSSSYDVYFQRFDNSGNPQGSNMKVNNLSTSYEIFPSVGCYSSGFIIAWSEPQQNNGTNDLIYHQRFDQTGTSLASAQMVSTITSSIQIRGSVIILPSSYIIAWYLNSSSDSTNTYYNVYARTYDYSGTGGSPFQVSTSTSDVLLGTLPPTGTALSNGGYVIVWSVRLTTSNVNQYDDVYAQVYDSSGNAVNANFIVNTAFKHYVQDEAAVIPLSGGGFFVVYTSDWVSGQNYYSIAGVEFDNAGTTIKDQFVVSPSQTMDETYPSIANFGNGRYVITKTSNGFISGLDVTYFIYPLPTCSNFGTININSGASADLNFIGKLSDQIDPFSSLTVKLKSLPANGKITLISTGADAVIDTAYPPSDLKFTAGNVVSDSFTYVVNNSVNMESEASCSANISITLCYSTCASCGGNIGSATDNQCVTCASGYYPNAADATQCIKPTQNLNGYYFDYSSMKFVKCIDNCLLCSNNVECDTCVDSTYRDTTNNVCLSSCPVGYYADTYSRACNQCITNCADCQDSFQCSKCMDGYYFNNLANQCTVTCPEGYFEDAVNNLCVSCYATCSTCSETGTTQDHKCETCKSGYYKEYGQTSNCLDIIPANYYFNSTLQEYKPCYPSCNTCTGDGDSVNHNCLTCLAGYKPKADMPTSCYNKVPPGYYYDNLKMEYEKCTDGGSTAVVTQQMSISNPSPSSFSYEEIPAFQLTVSESLSNSNSLTSINSVYLASKNISDTSLYYLQITSEKCLTLGVAAFSPLNEGEYYPTIIDGDGNKISSSQTIFITEPVINLTNQFTSFQQLKNYTENYISGLLTNNTVSDYQLLNAASIKSIVQIAKTSDQASKDAEKVAPENGGSIVDFKPCEEKLKKYYDIPKDQQLVYSLIDFNTTNPQNKIDFMVWDMAGKRLDVNICGNSTITFKSPIRDGANVNLTYAEEIHNQWSADVFNPNDPLFNDICHQFYNNKTDLTVNVRRSNVYQNMSVDCSQGCSYGGIDYVLKYVICNCNATSSQDVTENFVQNSLDQLIENNFDVLTCFNTVMVIERLVNNSGFFFSVIILSFVITVSSAVGLFYKPISPKNIDNYIHFDCFKFDYGKRINFEKVRRKSSNDLTNFLPPNPPKNSNTVLLKVNKPEKEDKKSDTEKVEDEAEIIRPVNIIKKKLTLYNVKEIINDEDEERVFNFPSKDNTFNLDSNNVSNEYNNEYSHKKYETILDKIGKEEENVEEKRVKLRVNRRSTADLITSDGFKVISPSRMSIADDAPNEDVNKYTCRDYERMKFRDILKKDKRSFIRFYWESLVRDHSIITIFFKKTLMVPLYIRIYHLVFCILLDFATNAVFYSDQYISEQYYSTANLDFFYTFIYQFPRNFYSMLLSCIIATVTELFLDPSEEAEEHLNEAYLTGKYEEIEKAYPHYLKLMRGKHITYFIISSLMFLFLGYFIICFCGVYVMSQSGWLQGGLISLLLRTGVMEVGIPILTTLNRTIAHKYESRCLYEFNFVVEILNIFS